MRRILLAVVTVFALGAGRAEALTIRDVIELSKSGLGDAVLLALIEVDRSVFSIDTATLKQLKAAGVSDPVIVAMIKSGREPMPAPAAAPQPAADPEPQPQPPIQRRPEPEVIVIDHHDAPAPPPAPVPVPYPVPVYVPVAAAYGSYYGGMYGGIYGATNPPGLAGGFTKTRVDRRTTEFTPHNVIETTLNTRDAGLVKAKLPVPPNCVKAEPVYWGFGGKLRPGSYEPPPTIVCR